MSTVTTSPDTQTPSRSPLVSAPPPPRKRIFTAQNLVGTLVGSYVPLIIATLIVALPLLWMVSASLKPTDEIVTLSPTLFPENPTFQNYVEASRTVSFGRLFLNSTIVTVLGASIKVVLAILTAYALVFIRFPGKRWVFFFILVALMVPPQVSILPNFQLIAGWGGMNTYWGIILPGLGTAFGTFLLRQHFLTLPASMLEAAQLDGAGHFRRLWQVVVPVSGPAIATVALVTIVNEWNDYLWPLIITDRAEMMTLPVGLTLLRNNESSLASFGTLMAGAVLVVVPVLIVFAMLQRHIVAGLTQGSTTG